MAIPDRVIPNIPVVASGDPTHTYAVPVAVQGGGGGGTAAIDEAAFAAAGSSGTPLMGVVNPADTPANGKLAIAALDASRNLKVNVVAGGAGGGAATIADGADVCEGATTDAAVVTDANGTVSAKLRGLVKILATVADLVNSWLQVKVMNATLATPARVDPTGTTTQPVSLQAGSAIAGKVGIDQTTPGTTNAVADTAATAGGLSIYAFLSTAAVQAAAIKASAGQVYALHFFNNSGTICYVRLYNQTASPGTGDTVVYRAIIPANTSGAGFVVPIPPGVAFGTGIGIRVTAAVADNDATALAANTILGNVFYK